jgi:hypothetical protein
MASIYQTALANAVKKKMTLPDGVQPPDGTTPGQQQAQATAAQATGAAQMNPYQATMAAATPTAGATTQSAFTDTSIPSGNTSTGAQQDYLVFGRSDPNFKVGMSDSDRGMWEAAGSKYAAGDDSWNRDTNIFRENGNWSGYYDDNGGYNGWLRAVNGVGGYAPAFGGKIGETGYDPGTVFYGPDGTAWTMGADGSLTKSGTVTTMPYGSSIGVKAGYQDSPFWVLEDGQYKKYTNQTAPDEVLEAQGYYRDANGLVLPQDREYYAAKLMESGQLTRQEYNAAMDVRNALKRHIPIGGVPSDSEPIDYRAANAASNEKLRNVGNTSGGGTPTPTPTTTTPTPTTTTPTTPTKTTPTGTPTETTPTGTTPAGTTPPAAETPFQAYLDQWDYEPAPEWNGTEYEQKRDAALEAAGEKWQGSEYQPLRDAALKRAEDMQWNYDVNSDPVYQAYQKQYRREGDRAMQEALAQASMRTGGLANSYAVTAASQAGDYYASQLSDKIPQLYQDAYQRYLQEFQRQMGISDQYQGFDDREYSRWADQQGRNFDLADRYYQYGNTEYQRYLDQLGQYNTDRNFSYGRYRDAVGDYRYDDETQYNRAWNEENRDYTRNYQAQRDAIEDARYDQEWAQKLRAYADDQNWKAKEWQQYLREYGDQLSEKERQWAYQMARDAVSDQQYADQQAWNRSTYADEREYEREQDALDNQYRSDVWNQSLREYDDEQEREAWNYLRTNGIVTGKYAQILGVPDGTTYEQYYSRYLGGGNGGAFEESEVANPDYTKKSTPPASTPPPTVVPRDEEGNLNLSEEDADAVRGSAIETVPGVVHSINGQPMTTGFQKWWPTIRDAYDQGATASEIIQAINNLIKQGVIADYEKDVILSKLGIYGNGGR